MNTVILLREFLFLEPLMDFQLWSGEIRDQTISGIRNFTDMETSLNIDSSLGEGRDGALAVSVILDHCTGDVLMRLSRQLSVGDVVFVLEGDSRVTLSGETYKSIRQMAITVIYIEHISHEQLLRQYEFACNLERSNQLLSYIASTSGFLFSMLNKQGIHHVWSFIERTVGYPLYLFNHRLEPIPVTVIMMPDIDDGRADWQLLRQAFYRNTNVADESFALSYETANGLQKWSFFRLTADVPMGFIGVLQNQRPILGIEMAQIQRLVPVVISELLKRREIIETKKLYKQNFLYDLLHNNLEESPDMIAKHGELWGWDLTRPHQLLLIELQQGFERQISHEDIEHIRLIVKNILTGYFKKAIIEELRRQFVLLYPEEYSEDRRQSKQRSKEIADKIHAKIREQFDQQNLKIAIGRLYPTAEELCRSYQEAKTALELSRHMQDVSTMHFEELGVMRLLANIRNEQLEDFFKEHLHELIAFDAENNTNLLHTLQVYFAENGNFKGTAQKLFVHTNTLRYRLKKVEEILNVDLQKPGEFVNLYVAMLIYTLHQS